MFHTYIICLFATGYCVLATPILSIEDYGDKLKDMVKMLHDTCVARSGVEESKIEEMKTGKFGNDQKARKYIHCVWTSTVISDSGTIDMDMVKEICPPKIKDKAPKILEECFKQFSDQPNLENRLYEMTKCIYKSDPDVTGSNKGIGFEIVKGLCKRFDGKVYLTSRDITKGKEAVIKLESLGYSPLFHQLDIGNEESIEKFRDYLKSTHGGIDVLVNNAGVRLLGPDPSGINATKTIAINYFGTLAVCDALFPLLRNNAKVVNISSSAGHLYRIPSEKLRKRFSDPALTPQQLNELMKKFIDDFKQNKLNEEGWPDDAYTVSKVGVSALFIIQQNAFDNETPNRNVKVNFVHPGWVKSDMNDKGNITPEEGARPTLFVILDNDELKGKYVWWDCQVVNWYNQDTPPRPYPIEYQ